MRFFMDRQTAQVWAFDFISGQKIFLYTDNVNCILTVKNGLDPMTVLQSTHKELK